MKKAIRNTIKDKRSLFNSLSDRSEASFWTGVLLFILFSIGFSYIVSKRVAYAEQYYNVTFSMNFLEDIRSGTKVRYQGGVIVGEIIAIESGFQNHMAHAQIKKDFLIPKRGSHISLKTWGYFGGKFINIEIAPGNKDEEPYPAYSVIMIEKVKNAAIVMDEIHSLFKKSDKSALSPLENKLEELKSMTDYLKNIPYIKPKVMRTLVSSGTKEYQKYIQHFLNLNLFLYENSDNLTETMKNISKFVSVEIPLYLDRTNQIKSHFLYDNYTIDPVYSSFWHDESNYYYAKALSEYIKEKSLQFKKNPYTLIYRE